MTSSPYPYLRTSAETLPQQRRATRAHARLNPAARRHTAALRLLAAGIKKGTTT